MSATGFHPEPSAKAPWTRTIVLTAAYAGDDAARAAPVRRARIKRFMVSSTVLAKSALSVGARRGIARMETMPPQVWRRRQAGDFKLNVIRAEISPRLATDEQILP